MRLGVWVLVVEDDEATRELLIDTLGEAGYQVRTAADGDAALALLRREGHPAVILLDGLMPGMDGATFLQAYRGHAGPHAPIVAISASNVAAEQLRQAGVDAVLPKPFLLAELLAVVGRFAQP